MDISKRVYVINENRHKIYTDVILPAFKNGNLRVINEVVDGEKVKIYLFPQIQEPQNAIGGTELNVVKSKELDEVYGELLDEYYCKPLNNIKEFYFGKRPTKDEIIKLFDQYGDEIKYLARESEEKSLFAGYIMENLIYMTINNYYTQISDLRKTRFVDLMKTNMEELKSMLEQNDELKEIFLRLQDKVLIGRKDTEITEDGKLKHVKATSILEHFNYIFIKTYGDKGLLDFDKLYEDGVLESIGDEDITNLLGGFLNDEQFYKVMGQARLQDYFSKVSKSDEREDRNELKKLFAHSPKEFILKNILPNKIVPVEKIIQYSKIQKSDIFSLDITHICKLLDEYKNGLGITYIEILNEYGKSLSGKDIMLLSQKGHVPAEKIIELSINKSLEITCPEKVISKKEFLEFYNAEVLLDMKNRGKLNIKFVQLFNENIINELDNNTAQNYFSNLTEDLEILAEADTEFKNNLFDFYKLKLLNKDNVKGHLNEEALNGVQLDEETSIRLFNDNIIGADFIKKHISNERILKLIEKNLSVEALKVLSEQELTDALIEEKISFENIMKVYLETDTIQLDTLKNLIELIEIEDDLALYINKDSKIERIEELFSNYLIDFEGLNNLRKQGTIDEESYNRLKDVISANEFYDKLDKTKVIRLLAQPEDINTSHTGSIIKAVSKKKSNIDFELEEDMLKTLLDIPDINNVPIIESIDDNGNYTSLNRYKVISVRKYGLVLLEKFEANNSMFVMPYQQAAYFLNENNSQSKRKRVIKEMDQVKVVIHSVNFARNTLEAVCKLSDDAQEHLKPNKRYIDEAKVYIDEIKEQYYKNKEKTRGE